MEKMNDLRDLLNHEIEDLYSAEEQIIAALPKMIEKAGNRTLKTALSEHLKITQEQKKRLDKVQQLMKKGEKEETGKKKGILSGLFGGGKHVCKGMQGIIEEGNKVISADMDPKVMDAAIIACTQKVEHYEICGYGTARSFARELNLTEVTNLLQQTLDEEYDADRKLTAMAEERINEEAETASSKRGTSAPGSGSSRSTRSASRERVEEREMEMVSNRGNAASRKTSNAEATSAPRKSSSPRSSGNGRSAGAKKTTGGSRSNSGASKSSGGRSSNGRSSSSGRSSQGR